MKRNIITFICLLFFFLLIEVTARYYGFNQFPLFEENKDYEYIHKSNQNTLIYRNKFITNEFSMRSKPIGKNDTLVVLLIGDSILNGTNLVDQDDIASTLIESKLKQNFNKNIRVLNISSYTWGPDNVYAYLKKYGTFNADLIVMINNSGDAYDNMTFKKIVGINESMPSKNYKIASIVLLNKAIYLLKNKILTKDDESPRIANQQFNTGFKNIDRLATQLNIPLVEYLHASKEELLTNRYNDDGQKIISFFKKRNREIIYELDYKPKTDYYLDIVHFNKIGQCFMSVVLYNYIYNYLKNKTKEE